jgi:hypothetical protein
VDPPLSLKGKLVLVGMLQGQLEPECGANSWFTDHVDGGAKFFQIAAHDREAQAGAHFGMDSILDPIEAIEDALLISLRDATTRIRQLNPQTGKG